MTKPKPPKAATPATPGLEDVNALLEGLDDNDYVLEFSEYNPASGRMDYLEPMNVGEVRALGVLEFARQRYTVPGSAVLKFQVRTRHRAGKYGKQKTFTIVGERKPRESSSSSAAGGATTTIAGVSSDGWMKVGLALGVPIATAFGTMLAKKLLDGPQVDPIMLELIRQGRRADRGEGVDPVELQRLIGDAEKRGEDRGRELGELRERADNATREPAEGAANVNGWGSVVYNTVRPLLKTINRHLALEERRVELRLERGGRRLPAATNTQPAQGTGSAGATRAESSSASGQPPAPAHDPTLDTNDELVQLLGQIPRGARMFLMAAAEDDEDPDAYVGLIVQKLDDDAYAAMGRLIEREDFLETLLKVSPKFRERRDWFAQLVEGLREHFRGESGDAGGASSSSSSSSSSSPAEGVA